jgi:hypothetical protein
LNIRYQEDYYIGVYVQTAADDGHYEEQFDRRITTSGIGSQGFINVENTNGLRRSFSSLFDIFLDFHSDFPFPIPANSTLTNPTSTSIQLGYFTNYSGGNTSIYSIRFNYEPVTPYRIPFDNPKAHLSPYYQYEDQYLYDLNLLEKWVETDKTIKSYQYGTIVVSYTRFTGDHAEYSIPVVVEIRDCPSYYK